MLFTRVPDTLDEGVLPADRKLMAGPQSPMS